MSQQNAAELCTLLVSEVYGEVSAKVVALLCQFGRLSLVDLKRHSKLPERILKQTLVVLVQQHLVVHYTFHEGNRDVTYYDCAWEQAYQLVHSGRIIRTAEERYGDNGAMIVSNMLELGHARVSDFLAAYGKVEKKSRGKEAEKTNGNAAPEVMSVGTLRELMGKMLEDRFLIQVHKHHMHPITDTENAMRKEVHELLHTQIKTAAKLAKEVDLRVLERMQAMKDGDADPHAGMTKVTGKRKASSSGGRSKKKNKVSEYDMGDGLDDIQWEINEDVVLRVNHEKFLVVWRNEELADLAEQRLGKVTARVYAEFLKRIEPRYRRCRDPIRDIDEDDPKKRIKLSAFALSKDFPKEIELTNSITVPEKPAKKRRKRSRSSNSDDDSDSGSDRRKKRDGKKKRRSEDSDDSEEVDEWAEDGSDDEIEGGSKRQTLIRQHCELLAEDSLKFLTTERGRSKNPEWSVDYKALARKMRQLELEKIVEERFSDTATRLLRLLKDKGKLDEKQLATIALLKQNEIRSTLSGMHEYGHVELQEVPKTNPPQVSRTYFLWYHDEERANSLLLSDVYKTMCRTMQRTSTERRKRHLLIEKSERTDVQENYDEYLSTIEKRELDIWKNREERLLVQLMRLDRVVMILRDF